MTSYRSFISYCLLYANTAISAGMAGIALSYCIFGASQSTLLLSLQLALYTIPVLLMPLAGSLVDRYSTSRVLAASLLSRACLLTLFATLAMKDEPPIPVLLAISFLVGVIRQPHPGGLRKVFSATIPDGEYVKTNGYINIVGPVGGAVGALLAGFLIATLGAPRTVLIAAGLFLTQVLMLLWVPNVKPAGEPVKVSFDWSGLRLIRQGGIETGLSIALAVMALATAPFQILLPGRMQEWGHGSSGYGVAMAASTVGITIGGLVVAWLGKRLSLRQGVLPGVIVVGASVGLIPEAGGSLPVVAGLIVLSGVGGAVAESFIFARFHETVAPEVQGRVFSALSGLESLAATLGFIAAGALAVLTGPDAVFWIAGAGSVLAAWFALRASLKLPREEQKEPHAAST
ncbi:MFS transporter [Streptomyces sp. ATCC 21386]|uniref:MFS transporter n=1 Tax=Streptomyces sp. ATCC 21386 TaxID=2699428 RepID=UPI001BFF8651|nr:MFS transporter [Streptomyces sp. ATCC 21386]